MADPSFQDWLARQDFRQDSVGDLYRSLKPAIEDGQGGPPSPAIFESAVEDYRVWMDHLVIASEWNKRELNRALNRAWTEWRSSLRGPK